MKTKTLFFLCLLLTFACNEKKEEKNEIIVDPSKDLLSIWTIGNGAWTLDYRLGNLTNNNFNAELRFTSGDVCTCVVQLNGSQASGNYTSSCLLTTDASNPDLDCSTWNSAVGGGAINTYTNASGFLSLCRYAGSCLTYH